MSSRGEAKAEDAAVSGACDEEGTCDAVGPASGGSALVGSAPVDEERERGGEGARV